MNQEVVEIWICGRKRKCGWRGTYDELRRVPDDALGAGASKGTCPDCGNDEFYIRKGPAPAIDFQI